MKRHSSDAAASFPLAIAHCQLARIFRPFRKRRDVNFLAIIVVPDIEVISFYDRAATQMLTGRFRYKIRQFGDAALVQTVKRGSAKFSKILNDSEEQRPIVWMFESADDVPPEFRAAADVFETIEKPDLQLCQAAIYKICGSRASDEDAKFVIDQPWKRNAAAFRRGRSLQRTLQLLHQPLKLEHGFPASAASPDDTAIGLKSLIGYGAAVDWGLQLAEDIADYRAGRIQWNDLDTGILLSGPTGCGKTRFAEVLAKSTGMTLVTGSPGLWQSAGHLGDYLREMRKAFADARSKSPSILLIDEFDGFGKRTLSGGDNCDYQRQVVNAALECLDGSIRREGVVVMGTTNFPELLDPAFLRAGRLGKHIQISLPDPDARIAILETYLGFRLSTAESESIAMVTDEWSGSQLEQLARNCRRLARRENRSADGADVLALVPDTFPFPPESLLSTAIHECGHAVIALSVGRQIQKIEILDRLVPKSGSQKIGGIRYITDQFLRRTRSYYLDEIAVALGGVAAELEIFDNFDDGAGGVLTADLAYATQLATLMEGVYGMGQSWVSEVCLNQREITNLRLRNPALIRKIDALLAEQMHLACELVKRNRDTIEALAAELAIRKTMTNREITDFLTKHELRIMGIEKTALSSSQIAELST